MPHPHFRMSQPGFDSLEIFSASCAKVHSRLALLPAPSLSFSVGSSRSGQGHRSAMPIRHGGMRKDSVVNAKLSRISYVQLVDPHIGIHKARFQREPLHS